jgi:two-component system, response regulator PdtaR
MMDQARILVVEDEGVVAIDIEEGLKSQGYEVVGVAQTGEDAIAEAERKLPDLILMDIRLKGDVDGITAATCVRDRFHIPVVFLTAYADEATLSRAKIAEPYGYILKPFEEVELRAAIELALHKHRSDGKGSETKRVHAEPSPLPTRISEEGVGDVGVSEFLRCTSVFSRLPAKELQFLADACHFASVKAGDLIAYEGEENASSFIVVEGRVAMFKTSLNGKELIVELLPPGDLFSIVVALQRLPYPLTARAQTDSKLLWVPCSTLSLVLDRHPELYRDFTEQMANRLRSSHDLARGLAHDRVEVRIASTLCALVPRFAIVKEDERSYVIGMTRQEIADLTGTTPETAIRTTKAMEREGLLDLARPGVVKIVNLSGLQELADSE